MVYITERDIENIQQTNETQRINILPYLYLNVSKNTMPLKKKWYIRSSKGRESKYECIGEFNPSRRGRGPEGHVSFKVAKEILAGKMLEKEQKKVAQRRSIAVNNPIFADMCKGWIEAYEARNRETTSINAKKIVRKYIQTSSFYNKRMKDITRREIVELADTCAIGSVKKLLGFIKNIFEYAYKRGFYVPEANTNATAVVPTTSDLDYDYKPNNFKAIIVPTEFGKLIKEVRKYLESNFITSRAILFLAYNFCRSKEMLSMQWKDVDIDFYNRITLPAEKTKQKEIFKIPFSKQTKKILLEIRDYRMENEEILENWRDAYVFHKQGNPYEPMSSTALHNFMHKIGYTKDIHCLHSFRSSASTMLREKLGQLPEVVEKQLGHKLGNKVVQAYNRADYMDQRKAMLQLYADYIDEITRYAEKEEEFYRRKTGSVHDEFTKIIDEYNKRFMVINSSGEVIQSWTNI